MILRINRYYDQGKRRDPVVLDETLVFGNRDKSSLQAIVQHEGESVHGGHYVIFLRRDGIWECRDDGMMREYEVARLPLYCPQNVYVVVYARSECTDGVRLDCFVYLSLNQTFWE